MTNNDKKLDIKIKELEEKIVSMSKEISEKNTTIEKNWDLFIRSKAEIENIKKQNIKDITNIQKYVLKDFSKEIINVIDSLENAIKIGKEKNDGIKLIYKMLTNILEKYNIKKICVKENDMFNPALHEAVHIEKNNENENNVILKILQNGYTIHDQVLRYTKVSISKKIDKKLGE